MVDGELKPKKNQDDERRNTQENWNISDYFKEIYVLDLIKH